MKNKKTYVLSAGCIFTGLFILIRFVPLNVIGVKFLPLIEFIFNILLFFPLIFLFSLITYFAPQQVFASWWSFAKYAAPTILIISIIINAGLHHSQGGQWQDIFDVPFLVALYSIFAVGSVVQILRGYSLSKSN